MECLTDDPLTRDEQQWEQEIDTELSFEPIPRLWANRWEAAGIIGTWMLGPLPLILVLLL